MARDRAQRFEHRMSDGEALMWNIEKDPWLNPSGAIVSILDRPVDVDRLRRRLADAVVHVPRLRERVVPGFARLSPPQWATDPEFDLDFHLRRISLPAPGTRRQLYDMVTRLYEDPYDRTRPLWMFAVIDGLEGGRGALFTKMHHSISDGIGAIRLAERYMELERDGPLPDPLDLDAIVADALDAEREAGLAPPESPGDALEQSLGHLFRRQVGVARRAVGEVATWTADPLRAVEVAAQVSTGLGSVVRQVRSGEEGVAGGSPLWRERSRRRHLESLRIPLDDMKAAGKALGASVNDMFVAGAVAGALAYHVDRDTPVDALNISFVVSTRTDDAIGGNAFVPTSLQIPGHDRDPEDLVHDVRDRMAAEREGMLGQNLMSGIAGVVNVLPTSVVAGMARARAARLDFATSNLRAAPFPVHIGGARVTDTVTMGPVAGTAMNLTVMSYDGDLHLGLFVDPVAIDAPADLRDRMAEAYVDLAAAGGVVLDLASGADD